MRRILPLLLLVALAGCRASRPVPELAPEPYGVHEQAVSFTELGDSLAADGAMEGLVAPYRDQLADRIGEVIGEATATFVKGQPEAPLGNLAADAMLADAQQWVDAPVDMALTNNGGLRVALNPGPITVGMIY